MDTAKLREFIQGMPAEGRAAYAAAAGTKAVYLSHIARGHRRPSAKLAIRLAEHSGGRLTRADLRPDLWGEP